MKNSNNSLTRYTPFIHRGDSVRTIMLDLIIAMIPALVWAVYAFGTRVLSLVAVSVISSVLFEYLFEVIFKKPITVLDLSAVVTGMLLAFTLPVGTPLWVPAVGTFVAIVLAKQLLGMIGRDIINPVITARIVLTLVFPAYVNGYIKPFGGKLSGLSVSAGDIVASATPLASLKADSVPDADIFDLFMGNVAGCIGEVSALLLLIGGVYLIIRGVISCHIPVSYIACVAVLSFLLPQTQSVQAYQFMLMELCSGGLMLAAVFMAGDYRGAPMTANGRIIYGIGCGVITVCVRFFTPLTEGAAVAILIMNILSPYIDRFTAPKPFGYIPKSNKE